MLDTLLWAVIKFGGLSNALRQVAEYSENMDKSRADLDGKLQKQYDSLVRISEALLASSAHVKSQDLTPGLGVVKELARIVI